MNRRDNVDHCDICEGRTAVKYTSARHISYTPERGAGEAANSTLRSFFLLVMKLHSVHTVLLTDLMVKLPFAFPVLLQNPSEVA